MSEGTAQREGEILVELGGIEIELGALDTTTEHLISKLEKVSRQEPPTLGGEKDSRVHKEAATEMGRMLYGSKEKIKDINGRLSNILHRMEL